MKYLPPYEINLQMRMLWEQKGALVTLIYGALSNSAAATPTSPRPQDGWTRFFLQLVPVIPPRFRPPGTIGEMQFEHPQNIYLEQILRLSESLAFRDPASLEKRAAAIERLLADGTVMTLEEAKAKVRPEPEPEP